jgi:hypothetical protein
MLPRIQDLSPELTQLSNNRVATSTLICLGGSCGERYTGLEQRCLRSATLLESKPKN